MIGKIAFQIIWRCGIQDCLSTGSVVERFGNNLQNRRVLPGVAQQETEKC
jgi:hypothetical protein